MQLPPHPELQLNYSSRAEAEQQTYKQVFYFGFISQFCHQNWDSNSRQDRNNSENRTNNISLEHHLSDRRQQKERRKHEKILARPPIFHSLCAHSSWVHLLIWSCHRLGNRDLQLLETNDLTREGQQLTAGSVTLLSCWDLPCSTGVVLKHF